LVFEPDGALLQLPVNLLVTEQAGIDAYHSRVDAGGDEFDFRGIAWLGRDKAISTALSPASFLDARRATPSAAGRAYIGLGQNAPVGPATRASLVRGAADAPDPAARSRSPRGTARSRPTSWCWRAGCSARRAPKC
jgi:hypothetical protein